MNTPVSFELAKLLKEKLWNTPTLNFYFEDGESKENVLKETTGMDYGSQFIIEFSELIENWNDKWVTRKNGDRCFGCSKDRGYFETFSAPTITEVVMWIYKKYGIWIYPSQNSKGLFQWNLDYNASGDKGMLEFNSPTEAYEAAIEYILEKLI